MPLFKPSELHLFLESLGIKAKKGLSQNFLIDGNIIRKIVSASDVHTGDLVLEIGPGPGALSEALLSEGARLLAVEKDTVLATALERLQTPQKTLEVIQEDILRFPIASEIKKRLSPGEKGKVIANLPYHLTTPILVELVPLHEEFSRLVVMVQEEVARRFVAAPGGKDYGSFTVFLNFYCTPRYAFKVSRNCFYPSPNVDSAVVVLDLHLPREVSSTEKFFQMTRTAFGKRRKMLRASLKELYPSASIESALISIGCNPEARPEQLSLDQFIALFERMNGGNDD